MNSRKMSYEEKQIIKKIIDKTKKQINAATISLCAILIITFLVLGPGKNFYLILIFVVGICALTVYVLKNKIASLKKDYLEEKVEKITGNISKIDTGHGGSYSYKILIKDKFHASVRREIFESIPAQKEMTFEYASNSKYIFTVDETPVDTGWNVL